MGLAEAFERLGLAKDDPHPEGAHPKQPRPRPDENRPPKEQN